MYQTQEQPKEQGRTPQPPNHKRIFYILLISGAYTTSKHYNKGNIYKIDRIRHETTRGQVKTQGNNKSCLNCLLDTLKHILYIY